MGAGGADSALRFAARTSSHPARAVSRWKALSGGKAAGCFPFFIPEEVLHAAGILPVTVCGDEYRGAPAPGPWSVLDAFVFPPVPAPPPEFVNVLTEAVPRLPHVSLRLSGTTEALSTVEALDRVELLREWAEKISGRPVTDGALGKSIGVFNENRRLFSAMGKRLASVPGAYSATELYWLFRSALAIPGEAHSELLHAALSRGPGRAFHSRIFLEGRIPTEAVVEAIDAAGAAVVGAAFLEGNRTPESMADEGGDPALALARRLRSQLLGWAERQAVPSWAARQVDRVEASGADRFLYLGAGAGLADRSGELAAEAKKRGIPFLSLEADPSGEGRDGTKARIGGFLGTGKSH